MTSSYRIRQLAEKDLEQIWLYTFHEWGIEQADKYIHLLIARFSWLSENQRLGNNGIKSMENQWNQWQNQQINGNQWGEINGVRLH
jgi:plasmid stabilization system protein ParE